MFYFSVSGSQYRDTQKWRRKYINGKHFTQEIKPGEEIPKNFNDRKPVFHGEYTQKDITYVEYPYTTAIVLFGTNNTGRTMYLYSETLAQRQEVEKKDRFFMKGKRYTHTVSPEQEIPDFKDTVSVLSGSYSPSDIKIVRYPYKMTA